MTALRVGGIRTPANRRNWTGETSGEELAPVRSMRRVGPRVRAGWIAVLALVVGLDSGTAAPDDATPLTPRRILTPPSVGGNPQTTLPLAFEVAGDDVTVARARGYVARITRFGAQVAVQDGANG